MFHSPGVIPPMPRTSRSECSNAAELRAQRRRARVIDDGSRIILSHPSTVPEVASHTSRSPQNLDSDCVTYLDVSHERWDGIVAPGRSRSSSVGALPPSTPSSGPPTTGHERNAWSSHHRPAMLEPLIEDLSPPNAQAPSELKRSHHRRVRDRNNAPLDHAQGRWVLDPRSGFEMYVPPSSPRRPLRPRMRSMPAPPRCAGEVRSLQPPLNQTTTSRHDSSKSERDDAKQQQKSSQPHIPPAPHPMPPSLAQFWEADARPPPAYELAPASPMAMSDTPLLDHAAERERQFLALLARDCGSGTLLQEVASSPKTATHRSNASKSSSRKSTGIAGKLSSGLAVGIPSFFRARRNTTAAQTNKEYRAVVLSH